MESRDGQIGVRTIGFHQHVCALPNEREPVRLSGLTSQGQRQTPIDPADGWLQNVVNEFLRFSEAEGTAGIFYGI